MLTDRRRVRLARWASAAVLLAPRPRLAQEDHIVAYAVLAGIVAGLLLAYLWKRRRLRRER